MKNFFALITLVILSFAIGLNSIVFAYSVDSSGSELVPNVLDFRAIPGDKHVSLSWSNPNYFDFSGVSILRSESAYISTYDPGQSIYQGSDKSYIDLELTNDKTYYYTIFVYSSSGVYSSGSIAKAVPRLPSITEPYQRAPSDFLDTSGERAPLSTKKIDKLALSDFYYYLVLDKKVLEIGLNDSDELHVVGGSTTLIEIPSDIFIKPVNVISVSTDESSYLMTLIPDKNKYQLVVSTPKNPDDSELRFVAVFKDKSISDIKTKLIIDPQGYVYFAGSNFFGFGKKQEMRVEGAKITLYQKEDNKWEVWNAEKYFQQNPQLTDASGEYAYFLPRGEYYVEVNKTGFRKYKSDPFDAGPEIFNRQIEISPLVDLPVITVMVIIVISLFIFWIMRWKKSNSKV